MPDKALNSAAVCVLSTDAGAAPPPLSNPNYIALIPPTTSPLDTWANPSAPSYVTSVVLIKRSYRQSDISKNIGSALLNPVAKNAPALSSAACVTHEEDELTEVVATAEEDEPSSGAPL